MEQKPMKPENKSLIKALLESTESLQQDIYDDAEQMLGTVPFILRAMARRPEFMIFSSIKDFYALRPNSLEPKTAELLAVSAAAASGADRCLKVHMNAAAQEGASEDEILDAIFIASIIGQTKVLASALRTFQEFEERSKGE
ncbi:MAG: carboxymuconolactone decarboxylase family protein [Methanothrix sp.]|nr:carboxymuconolactone decarboxylase family protein [Methanothrix sp.]